jgi:serine/threonine protein kinase
MAERKVCIKEFFPKDFYNRDSTTNGVLLGTQGSAEYMERYKEKFIKEAKTIAKFDHPNIIHIFDVFEENNTCYYVMEYIDGESLHDRVQRLGAMAEGDALRYIREAGAALAHIHSNSVNHLDIKPSNIMIRRSDNRAILIDFGVSKHYDKNGSQTSATPVGLSHGFAPMEQYREGGVSSFSPETDIYSLGATLYSILTATIPPPASDVAEDGIPALPEHLERATCRAIECAMEMRRKDRPHSVEEFLALLDGSATPPRSESPKATPVAPPISAPKAAYVPVSEETVVGAPQADSPKAAPASAPAGEETVISSSNGGATTPPPPSAQPKKEWTPRYGGDNKRGKSTESKPKKSSKVGLIVSILIGLLLIGGGAYFLMVANSSNNSDASDDYSYNYDYSYEEPGYIDESSSNYNYEEPYAYETYEAYEEPQEVAEVSYAETHVAEEYQPYDDGTAEASYPNISDDGYSYDDGAYISGEICYNDYGGIYYYLNDGRYVEIDEYGNKYYYYFDEYGNMYDVNWNFICGPNGEDYQVYEY